MGFAENLKKIRGEKHLSQQALANKLSVAQSTIGMWEAGRRTPKLSELNRLAKILNITINRLLIGPKERKVEVIKNEIYIDGQRVEELDPQDAEGIIEYINSLKAGKSKPVSKPPDGVLSKAKKVLVVDDEQEICELLFTFLVPHNYKVFLAFNGQMALEYFEEIKPDLVLLDLKLPDIDGVEVLKIIRKVSHVPVVIITANPQDVSDIHLADLKIEGYIEKPIKLLDILNTIKHIIGE